MHMLKILYILLNCYTLIYRELYTILIYWELYDILIYWELYNILIYWELIEDVGQTLIKTHKVLPVSIFLITYY